MYDFVIVGAGSAGCVLANRLSANPGHRVLLVEAGPRDWHPFIHMPAGLAKLVGKKSINWDYSTEPEPQLDNRRLWWPRGKVLGGSSSINAMCYIRGHRLDYDEWAAQGASGWSFAEVLPYFKRAQNSERGASELHGIGGPLNVADLRYRNRLSQVFLDAAAEQGLPANTDFNGAGQEGFGWYQVTQKDGARCSAATGYLHPALERDNLTLITRAHARRVVIERGRAVAIELEHRGQRLRIEASREVILAGGAINSPQLLMLSGVGPAAHLRAHGIDLVHASEQVGANLHDHLDACTIYRCTQPVTYDRPNDLMVAWNYFVHREGMGTSNIAEAGGFARSPFAPDSRPDLQFHFVPALLDDHGRHRMPGYGFTLHACALRPRSRGRIELASADPAAKARIFANYLSDAEGFDLRTMVEGVKLSRRILGAKAFADYRGEELYPGAGVVDDAGIESFIRARAETIYHPVGTCRMGGDAGAVVDPQLRVRGVDGLRVVDASVMPTLIGGNTNAPTIMIAEKASELILGTVASRAAAEAVTA